MTYFRILLLSCVVLAVSSAVAQSANSSSSTVSAKAQAIHDSAIVVDTHADTPQRFLDEGFDIGSTDLNDAGHISLDKARRGNLGAEFFSIWVDPGQYSADESACRTLSLIDATIDQVRRAPDKDRKSTRLNSSH